MTYLNKLVIFIYVDQKKKEFGDYIRKLQDHEKAKSSLKVQPEAYSDDTDSSSDFDNRPFDMKDSRDVFW